MNLCIRLIPSDIHSLRILRTSKFCHHIFDYRSRSSCPCNIKCFFDNPPQIFSFLYRNSIFADTSCNSDNINFLKCIISDQISCDLPCKTHKRNTVIVGCRNSGNKIRRPGTACHKTDTYLSGRSCIGIRRMHKRLLVSWQNHFCIVLLIKLIADINRTGAWISEQNIHPFFF